MNIQVMCIMALFCAGCSNLAKSDNHASDSDSFTLYRNSPIDLTMRIYIATFDSTEGYDDRDYNFENCTRAERAFENDAQFGGAHFYCQEGRNNH
jgi:hypothetical protein